jgi:hypothetical protein
MDRNRRRVLPWIGALTLVALGGCYATTEPYYGASYAYYGPSGYYYGYYPHRYYGYAWPGYRRPIYVRPAPHVYVHPYRGGGWGGGPGHWHGGGWHR